MGFGTNAVFADLTAFPYPVADFGIDQAFDAIEDLFIAQNKLVHEQLDMFVGRTDKQYMIAAAPDSTTTQELDEFGTPPPQKIVAGQQIGFPLRKFGAAWQATFTAMQVMTGKELAADATAVAYADLNRIQQRIRNAFYTPTNYLFTDRLMDRRQQFQLPIKALANADGFPIPIGPNGEIFDPTTHNHYMATVGVSVLQSDYDLLITNVMEHHRSGQPMLAINQANEAFVRGFIAANGLGIFSPDVDVRVIQPLTQIYTTAGLEIANLYNRRIGLYRGVEVWVKPWVIAGYPVCWQVGADIDKPLMLRERTSGSGDLRLVWDGTGHPLNAKVWEREFDVAVFHRIAGAVLDSTHQTTYQAPLIPAA